MKRSASFFQEGLPAIDTVLMTEFSISVQTAMIQAISFCVMYRHFLCLYSQQNRNFSSLCLQRSSVDILSENSKNLHYILLPFNILKVRCESNSFERISCIKSPFTLHWCDFAILGTCLLSRAASS